MARIRSIKPEFWDDRKLAKRTSRDARLLYIGLWNLADEHCRLNGDPQWIKGQVFSFEEDLDAAAVTALLKELEQAERIILYEVEDDPYIYLPFLARHQRLEPKVPSRLPAPPAPYANLSESDADKSAWDADSPESDADKSAPSYVAGSRGQVAGSRGTRVTATALGCSLLDEHIAQVRPRPPRDVLRSTGDRIERLLAEGIPDEDIRGGLALLREKVNVGPGLLPTLVDQVRRQRVTPQLPRGSPSQPMSAADQRRADVAQLRELDRQQREGQPPPVQPARVITGSVIE